MAAQAVGEPAAGARRLGLCHGGRAGGVHPARRSPAPAGGRGRDPHPLVAEPRTPLPATPGPPPRVDSEAARRGTAQLCRLVAPLAGNRPVKVTERRTAVDCAARLRDVVDAHDPPAETMVLVLDHLNPPTPASLYAAFPPAAARRRLERLERHDTPTHGRWLTMAATERRVLATPGVGRRIPAATPRTPAVAAWEGHRQVAKCRGEGRFTTQDASIKLKRLSPSIQLG